VKSDTQRAFGQEAWKCRFTWSRGQGTAGLLIVVFTGLPRIAPETGCNNGF
jgi:hypothetical protein